MKLAPSSPEPRAQLRARSAIARASAKAAAARCLELKSKFEASISERAHWRESLTRVLPELRESVGRYARCLKAEGAPPEQMLVLVEEALHEALPSSMSGASAILDLSAGCAIEAYYEPDGGMKQWPVLQAGHCERSLKSFEISDEIRLLLRG